MSLTLKILLKIMYVYCCEYIEINKNNETQHETNSLSVDLCVYTFKQKLENFYMYEGIKTCEEGNSDLILNNCINSLNDLDETSNEDLEGYLNFLEPIKWSSDENSEKNTNKNIKISESFTVPNDNLAIYENQDEDFLPIRFAKFVEEFYYSITVYVGTNVCKKHQNTYLKRLDMIKETLIFLNEHTIKDIEVFTTEIDNMLKNILISLWIKYKHFLVLNNLIYDQFSRDFDIKLKEIERLKNFKAVHKMICSRKYIHLKEFMIIYRYIKTFPELISLGYIATQKPFKKVTFVFRLIVLFLQQNEHDLIKDRVFVMFLLKKAFSSTAKCNLDHIYTLNIQDSTDISNLFFFSWEFNHYQRAKQKSRINLLVDSNRYFYEEDRIHYNVVLRLYLFQHLIYLKYENVNKYEFEKFRNFIENVFADFDCYKRYFYQFIEMF